MRITVFLVLLLVADIVLANRLSVPSTYSTIHSAIKAASPYDTIFVKGGKWKEGNISIDKPLSLIGIDYPVLDGETKYEIISVHASHSLVKGFRLINTGYSSLEDMAAVKTYSCKDVTVSDNIVENAFFGIYFTNSIECNVLNNKISGPAERNQNDVGNGIHLWKCSGNKIIGNSITGHRDGIYFEFVRKTVIARNYSTLNLRYGLHFMFSDSDSYYHNTFLNNGAGVAVMYSRDVHMIGNHFDHNWGGSAYGLLLKDIRDSYICGNSFVKNTVAIHMEGCSRSVMFRNEFRENGYAIRLQADCDDNRIRCNNFFANTFDMITNGATVLNILEFNYWDKYEGYDLKKDGVGDQPFRPMSLFSYMIETNPVTVVLLRSFLSGLLDTLEKLIPGITPVELQDPSPLMNRYARNT